MGLVDSENDTDDVPCLEASSSDEDPAEEPKDEPDDDDDGFALQPDPQALKKWDANLEVCAKAAGFLPRRSPG